MRIDLRVKRDVETRRLAAGLLADGSGRAAAAKRPSVPEAAVRRWRQKYRAFGSGTLLTMDGKRAGYAYGQKAAAARAVVEDVSVNIIFTIFTNVFSPIAPTRMRRIRQRGCATFGA